MVETGIERTTEYLPYRCSECGADLAERGAVVSYVILPELLVGHVEPGEGDGVNFVLDKMENNPPLELACANCGVELPQLNVEDYYLDPECETEGELLHP